MKKIRQIIVNILEADEGTKIIIYTTLLLAITSISLSHRNPWYLLFAACLLMISYAAYKYRNK